MSLDAPPRSEAATTPPAGYAPDALERVDGPEKVRGEARYAAERRFEGRVHAVPVTATVAAGRVVALHVDEVLALPGVLAVLTRENAMALHVEADGELAVLQDDRVAHHGQVVAAVVATTLEEATEAAARLRVDYEVAPHDVTLTVDHPRQFTPEVVNPNFPPDTLDGDPDAAFAASPVQVDATYQTPVEHNNPLEPHATTARWEGGDLWLVDSIQGTSRSQQLLGELFGLPPERLHLECQHVGGGFGSKGTSRPQAVLAAMAARLVDRPVTCAFSRRQMFTATGYRTPTIQRVRLGADRDGRLRSIRHEAWELTGTRKEFAEQTTVVTRHLYAADHRATSHRVARLDVPTPSWMRAPGECPGMFALESAMDELAVAAGIDPVELRLRNDTAVDPESGRPFGGRDLAGCLRQGAARFGWEGRDPAPGTRRDGRWLVGTGMAVSTYPARAMASEARVTATPDGRYRVEVGAADIGTGARTALVLFAARQLRVAPEQVDLRIGDSHLPTAMIAGGSMGTASWTWAVGLAIEELQAQLAELGGQVPPGGLAVDASSEEAVAAVADRPAFSYGAQFVEARVDVGTGEVRVPRLVGCFAAGRIVNPLTARSQLMGGMVMGLSMALFEGSRFDPATGDVLTADLAQYHVATNADVGEVDVSWLDEADPDLGPAQAKGIGELGIVGTAAAVANAVHHATGVRVRDLPITPDKLL